MHTKIHTYIHKYIHSIRIRTYNVQAHMRKLDVTCVSLSKQCQAESHIRTRASIFQSKRCHTHSTTRCLTLLCVFISRTNVPITGGGFSIGVGGIARPFLHCRDISHAVHILGHARHGERTRIRILSLEMLRGFCVLWVSAGRGDSKFRYPTRRKLMAIDGNFL
jgi:hypothetical protein